MEDAKDVMYLATSPDKKFLYAAESMPSCTNPQGGISVYAIFDNKATRISSRPVSPTVPCHISVSNDGTLIAFAEYANGIAGILKILPDGTLSEPIATVKHEGTPGPNKKRQDAPHCHCTTFSPDDKHIYVCDLGLDKIFDYEITPNGMTEIETTGFKSQPGSGPRHIVFHPTNKTLAFVINELSNTVDSLLITETGFNLVNSYKILPTDFRGCTKAAALKFSKNGNMLLASTRGYDSIAVFSVNTNNGTLNRLAVNRLCGEFPRDFEFVHGNKYIIAGHELSNEIAVYEFGSDRKTLSQLGSVFEITKPVCFAFA